MCVLVILQAYSAGSNPTGKINENIKLYLTKIKNFNLENYSSKNFEIFLDKKFNIDHVITVCNNANNEVCPIWPNNNQIIHWDIEDPVSKFKNSNENQINGIINLTYDTINEKINIWLKNEN
ncbi:MAG: arsenate reductase ArsC [Gammaproteobacteria bacterium]